MKITIYTVSQCQFSKAEKEYLQLHNLPFEEKNLEQNREWLTEMLAVSNNFAGTPVTKIEKDDGSIVVLKGFTKEEFDKELGIEQPPVAQANAQVNLPQQTPSSPVPQPPQQPQVPPSTQSTSPQSPSQPSTSQSQPVDQKQEESSLPQPSQQPQVPPSTQPISPQSPSQPSQPLNQPQQEEPSLSSVVEESPEKSSNNPPPNDQLNTILEDLKTKSQAPSSSPSQSNPPPVDDLPNIPDFKDKI